MRTIWALWSACRTILQLQTFLQALDWEGKVKEKQEKKVLRKSGLEVKRKKTVQLQKLAAGNAMVTLGKNGAKIGPLRCTPQLLSRGTRSPLLSGEDEGVPGGAKPGQNYVSRLRPRHFPGGLHLKSLLNLHANIPLCSLWLQAPAAVGALAGISKLLPWGLHSAASAPVWQIFLLTTVQSLSPVILGIAS